MRVSRVGSRVIPVRLDDDTVSLIDELVELGLFESRSEALRAIIRAGAKETVWLGEITRGVEKLFRLEEEEGEIPLKLEGGLADLLEGRGRL